MKLTFKIGERAQDVEIKDENLIAVLTPNDDALPKVINKDTEFAEVKKALEEPIGSPRLKDISPVRK